MDSTQSPSVRDPNHVFVGFPQYDNCVSRALRNLQVILRTGALPQYRFTFYEAQSFSASKARNVICAEALKTDAGKLLMIDADMEPTVAHVERILSHKERVVGGLYPKKLLRDEPEWVAHFRVGCAKDARGMCEAVEVGAGFLRIDMDVLDTLRGVGNHAKYVTEYLSDDEQARGEKQWQFFTETVIPYDWTIPGKDWPRRLGEDFFFCFKCWRAGVPVFVDCGCQVPHVGPVDYLALYALIERIIEEARDELLLGGARAPHGTTDPVLPAHT